MHLDTTMELAAIRRSEIAGHAHRHATTRPPRAPRGLGRRMRSIRHIRHVTITEGAGSC